MSIDIKTAAQLRHINVRKEGPDEDKVTAIDLKFTGRVPAEFVDSLACPDEEAGNLLRAFWDADGDPAFFSLKEIGIRREVLNVTVDVDGLSLTGCTLKNFSFQALEERQAEISFGLSTSTFPSNTIAVLAEQLHEVLGVHLWTPQGDLFEEKGQVEKPRAMPGSSEEQVGFFDGPGASDPLYEKALAFVRESGRPSISFVQRALKIGYNRAARLIEAMEAAGVVSTMAANGQRTVLAQGASA